MLINCGIFFFVKKLVSLQRHNTENSKQKFPEKELRGLSPNFHIHVSVSDLYIPMIRLLQENMWTDPGIIYSYKSLTEYMTVEIVTEAARNSYSGNA